jgi:hypothetical protein
MNSISELRLLTPRPVALAEPGRLTATAGAGTPGPTSMMPAPSRPQVATTAALEQIERPAARTQASEPTRSQSAEHRLRRNRLEEGPTPSGAGGPEVELSFGDFIDLINPLHHIPIVGTIYRAITGDEIGGPAKILGGMLFGGPIGFIAAAFDTIVSQATGRDLGETVVAAFIDHDAAPVVQVATAPDIQSMSTQEEPPEGNPATSNGAPGPISSHKDPFGLQRETTAPIEATPGALVPIEVTSAALPPNPPAAGIPNTGLKSITIDKIAQIHGVEEIASAAPDLKQPALDGNPLVPITPKPGSLHLPVAVDFVSADASPSSPQRSIPGFAATDRGFTERMLEALDKYQAQTTERLRNNSHETERLNINL